MYLELNVNRCTHSELTVSVNNTDCESPRGSGSKAKFGAIRAIIGTSKLRNSLKRRRGGGFHRSKNLSLPIEDIRDAKDQQAVEELRRELIIRNLLPDLHDDYHVLLRLVLQQSMLVNLLSLQIEDTNYANRVV